MEGPKDCSVVEKVGRAAEGRWTWLGLVEGDGRVMLGRWRT